MSEIDQMIRTREVQDAALAEIEQKIKSCQDSLSNFGHLSDRITTLPDKLSYDIMVPFGKFAFMPGKLVHTNEVMVHLGDAYFATVTCKQALKIIELRQKNLETTMGDLEKVATNIKEKRNYLGDIEQAAKGEEFEIREECPDSYVHPKDRKRTSRVNENRDTEPSHNRGDGVHKNTFAEKKDALMARLDELERMEEEDDEQDRALVDQNDDIDSSRETCSTTSNKRVRFRQNVPEPCTIRFKHSDAKSRSSEAMTPGDVHGLVKQQQQQKPILKPARDSQAIGEAPLQECHTKLEETSVLSNLVVERSTNESLKPSSTDGSKRVSKFKASRMKGGL